MPLPLSETIVAGASGHIGDHNLLHDTANRIEGIALNALEYDVRPANSGATNRVNLGTAIAAAVTLGRPLYVPAGNYTLTYDASNKFIPVGGKLHLIGAGRGVTTLTCNPTVMTFTDLCMLQTTATGEIHISDLTVQGPTAGSGNDSFDENSAFLRKFTQGDLTLERLQVKGNLGSTFSHSHASDVTIRVTDCKMTNYAGAGSAFESSKNQTKCIVIIDGCEVHDIESLGTSGAPEPDNVGFYIHPHFEVHCSNSVFRNIPRWGIYMNSGSAPGTANSKGVFVDNCTFIDAKAVQCTSNGVTVITNCVLYNSEIMMRSGDVTIDSLIGIGSKCQITGSIGTATETFSLSNININLTDDSLTVLQFDSLAACRYVLRNVNIKNTSATPQGYGIITSNSASVAIHDWDGVFISGSFTVPIKLNNFDKAKIRNLKINGVNLTPGTAHMMIEGTPGELELNDFHITGSSTERGLKLFSTVTANKIIGKDWRFTGSSSIPIDITTAGQQRVERRRGVAPTAISSSATLNLYDGAEKCSYDTFRISGSTTINTITPGPFSGKLTLIATGAWSTSGSGNIKAKVGTARTVDRAYTFYFNPDTALWYELDDIGAAGGVTAHDLRGDSHTDALKPAAALTETIARSNRPALSNAALLASGRMHLTAIYLPTATLITSITYLSSGTALVTGTNQWFALYNSALGLLRQSVDDTSTAWGVSAFKTLALTSTFLTTYSGLHYLGIMVAATTVPSIACVAALTASEKIQGLTPIDNGSSTTGLTSTAPSTAGLSANASNVPYAYVS